MVTSRHGLSATIGWSTPGKTEYAIEGNITLTGGAVQWAGELLGLPDALAVAALAASVSSSEGVYMVPAMAGLGAPYWRDDARGMIAGLTRGSKAAHVARAAVDSVAYQVRDVFDAMAMDTGEEPDVLMADGGASQNDQLMQFQADILGKPVVRNLSTDLSAIGAAWLAGLATGMWSGVAELGEIPRQEDRFEPKSGSDEREKLYRGWRESVARVLFDARAGEAAT
jgi:glycerol kinase